MKIDGNYLKAEEGKMLVRISDGYEAGKEIYLGKTWYIGGKKLDTPLDELPEHYQEIDDPYKYDEDGNRIYEEDIINEEYTNYEEVE